MPDLPIKPQAQKLTGGFGGEIPVVRLHKSADNCRFARRQMRTLHSRLSMKFVRLSSYQILAYRAKATFHAHLHRFRWRDRGCKGLKKRVLAAIPQRGDKTPCPRPPPPAPRPPAHAGEGMAPGFPSGDGKSPNPTS